VKDSIIEIIKWIRESVRPVVVIFVLSAMVLFAPHSWASSLGLADGFSKYRFVAFLCFVGSLVWLVSFPIEKQFIHRKRERYLKHLTEEERNVLKPFILNAKKTQAFRMNLGIARHLAQQRLLVETSTVDVRGHTVFVMDDWVFSHLKKHSELLGA
jgi:hypothetical protein